MGNNIKKDPIILCDGEWIEFGGQLAGCFEHGNEPSGSVNGAEILEHLNDC
jgi:hypothetical protein